MKSFRNEILRILEEKPDLAWLTLYRPDGKFEQYANRRIIQRTADYYALYQSLGVKEGDTVLIILKESLDLFASFFAGIMYGALPAFFAYPSPKQSREAFLQSVDNLILYNNIRVIVSFSDVIDVLQTHSVLSQKNFLGLINFENVLSSNSLDFNRFFTPKSEAFLQFSSGTTGAKKGVKISTNALLNQIEAYSDFVKFDEKSVIVSWLPHYHDMGLIACMLMPYLRQIPIVMMSPFEWVKNPKLLFSAITEFSGTHTWQPNFALGHLTKSVSLDESKHFNLSSLKQIILCSEPVLYETAQRFIQKFSQLGLSENSLFDCYAMAENTFAMTSTKGGKLQFLGIQQEAFQRNVIVEQADGKQIASAGFPLKNIGIKVEDEKGQNVGEDRVGEVWIQSDCMLDCYHNNPEETAKAIREGWFNTGDLGFLHKAELYVTGRKKDIIIVGGENIYPQDIELILNDEPYLAPGRNAVFGVDDERIGTERIVILAEAKEGFEKTDSTLLKTKIFNALSISVSEIIFLPLMTLKKGTAGKISRHLNKLEYLGGAFRTKSKISDKKSLKDVVLQAIPGSAKPHIHAETPLLSSGIIDSFGFIDLVAGIEKEFEISIPEEFLKPEFFETISIIEQTIGLVQKGAFDGNETENPSVSQLRRESLARLKSKLTVTAGGAPFWENAINRFPLKGSFWFRWLFKKAGITLGKNVAFLGKVKVKLRGKPENIVIGDNVILGDGVDLRNRENGKIILCERVYVDANVRLVAARDGCIDVGFGSEIGGGTIINSGGKTIIGEFCMIAGNVNINSSRHGTKKFAFVKEQAHLHGFIEIGDDVWVGSGASILINSKLNEGCVVASNSLVSGEIPAFALCAGVPAKVIQYR